MSAILSPLADGRLPAWRVGIGPGVTSYHGEANGMRVSYVHLGPPLDLFVLPVDQPEAFGVQMVDADGNVYTTRYQAKPGFVSLRLPETPWTDGTEGEWHADGCMCDDCCGCVCGEW